jgi:hypothetical protein
VNILTAIADNESLMKKENDGERKAIALVRLLHLVGDIHQALHTAHQSPLSITTVIKGGMKSACGILDMRCLLFHDGTFYRQLGTLLDKICVYFIKDIGSIDVSKYITVTS